MSKIAGKRTLRDYFAAKAMQGLVSYMGCDPDVIGPMGKDQNMLNKEKIAKSAYSYADAMLAERKIDHE